MSLIKKLQDDLAANMSASNALLEIDGWTDEQAAEAEKLEADAKMLDGKLATAKANQDRERALIPEAVRETLDAEGRTDDITVADQPPFATFGEQLSAIAGAASGNEQPDPRLHKVRELYGAATGMSSGIGSDGGFLIQPTFTNELLTRANELAVILPRCNRIPIGPNSDSLEAPLVDETSRASGSRWGGVSVARVAEGGTPTASKPKIRQLKIRLEDLMGIAYATDRLLRDSTALGAIMSQAFTEELAFVIDDEILTGVGGFECVGVIGHSGTVSVAKESNQVAATIKGANIVKMYARMWTRAITSGAVWLYNQDVIPELLRMTFKTGTTEALVWTRPGGIPESPYGSILGIPTVPCEQCKTLGTVGDIILANFRQYVIIEKGGINAAQSMHVKFINAEQTFRWIYSINGQPQMNSKLTPANGTNTVSSFVTLATRA